MASTQAIALQLQRLANESTEKSFQYNSQEANTARTWQKMMSDTSHQREVADLKKAGLNPVLSSGGSGAQSYTTSSASAQADNAVNAIGGVYQSQISADATRAAAAQSAAAMKSAAATQAAAARYAAAMQFASQKYHSDKAYEATKYRADKDYQIAMNKPVGNIAGLVDKWAQKTGLSTGAAKAITANAKKLVNNPMSYFSNKDNVSASNFKLNNAGVIAAGRGLAQMNVTNNARNRNLFVKAFVFGNSSAMASLRSQAIVYRTQSKIRTVQQKMYTPATQAMTRYWSSGRR